MHWCLLLSILSFAPSVLCLDMTVTFGSTVSAEGYPTIYNELFNILEALEAEIANNPWGDQFDVLENFYGPEYSDFSWYRFDTGYFAPWPAPHTTLYTTYARGMRVGINDKGFFPFYDTFFNRIPGEYLGISFDLPVTELFAEFEVRSRAFQYVYSNQYYYQGTINNVFGWPYETNPSERDDDNVLEIIFPFHITARTSDGYYYYDWLIPRASDPLNEIYTNGDYVTGFEKTLFLLASDPRGIDLLKVYSMIPEVNRGNIYADYNGEYYILPFFYNYLYLQTLIARLATPSSTRTITATTTPSPNFQRHPTFSATISPTITHSVSPSASRTRIFASTSNTPSRTPNRSPSNTPSRSSSPVPSASRAPSV